MSGLSGSRMPLDARNPTGGLCMCGEVSEQELLTKAEAGDRTALGELLLLNYSQLARYIALKLPTSVQGTLSVDDILQQTFLRAFRSFRRLEQPTPPSFTAWLRRIADNQMNDLCRKRGRERIAPAQVLGDDSDRETIEDLLNQIGANGLTPSDKAMRTEAFQLLRLAIAGLPPEHRDVIEMHDIQGEDLKTIAAKMRRTVASVRSLRHRAIKKLQAELVRLSSLF